MSRSKLCENGPEIVEKKYTAAHSIHDVTPRKNKKVRYVRGTICGVFRYLLKIKPFLSNLKIIQKNCFLLIHKQKTKTYED
jgi:hypothetical protein